MDIIIYVPAIIHLTCPPYILRRLKRVAVKNVEGKSLVLPLLVFGASLDLTCAPSVSGQLPKDQEPLRFKDGKKKTIFHYSHCHELSFFKYRKVCGDKIPRTLSHSLHPKHPLRLTYTYKNRKCNVCSEVCGTGTPLYVCEICSFRLDFHCAKLSPSLKLDCHHHLLTFFKDFNKEAEEGQDSYCKACGKHLENASIFFSLDLM
ncbi:hypothetical protein GOBAR_DD27140 [Gossypium barbadense]|nr:hypothetical protein GOBAR_DD27140 [Gossypium barbadense]